MSKAWRTYAFLLVIACGGDRAPGKDTARVEASPPDDSLIPPRVSTWNRAAGDFFAVRSETGGQSFIVNPAYGDAQALDTLTAAEWNVEGSSLVLLDGAQVVGTGRITGFHYDSTCAGWPTATLVSDGALPPPWRVAFPEGRVEGLPFDSLQALTSADSAERARIGALTASRLPDDTLTAFRGRPFAVRQAHRVTIAADTIVNVFEIVRLVAQEANPLQEQLVIVTEEVPGREPAGVFHRREVGAEEKMGSIELLGAFRVRSTGRIALLVRREREAGLTFEWIERTPRGVWVVRWRSATDSC
jgi:hypothetical protein